MVNLVTGTFAPRILSLRLPKTRVNQDNPKNIIELKEPIRKETTSFGSEVRKLSSTVGRKGLRIVTNQEVITLKKVIFEN